MNYITASLSQTGGRSHNEDYVGQADTGFCWVLADGAGGHKGGEIASRLAVERVLASFEAAPSVSSEALSGHIKAAQDAVTTRQTEEPALADMRTTLVVLLCDDKSGIWGHAGDSRLYHLHQGRIREMTEDHSVVQKLVNAGQLMPEAVQDHPDRSRLYRAIGREELDFDLRETPCTLEPGDAFLLCSDGFWDYLQDTEIEVDYAKSPDPEAWLSLLELRIMARAPDNHDNYSAISIFVTA